MVALAAVLSSGTVRIEPACGVKSYQRLLLNRHASRSGPVTAKPSPIAASDSGLPDFQHPPVDEVALSLQFPGVNDFTVAHFGLFWERLRRDYPRFESRQPIANVTEEFGPSVAFTRQVAFALREVPEVRAWYLDESGN
ncbi:MAG TPA: hypothetical protein VFI86_07290, partial [Burkholderiales bacterium]|nr:hypothetical protein [Burkholderiales bacterium]